MRWSGYEETVEEIRRRADIVSLVGEYVSLRKAGKNYTGLCPFHQEKTPSFSVSPEKQIFHCFGCGEHGDVFTFVMKIDGLSFPEAVRRLAQKTGVVVPERSLAPEEKERFTLREQILKANVLAGDYFSRMLVSPSGEKARNYLDKRGIGQSAVDAFRIGYAPEGWQGLLDYLHRKGVSSDVAQQAGLAIPRSGEGNKGHYDRFRGRIIIPIEDAEGRVVAFGGRVMDGGEPKYLNSPESPVYTKGNNLFGLFRTKESIRGKGFAILVEGYFDLVSLWVSGIRNVVATLGTALTRSQVDLLGRYTRKAAALFDPDEAGRKALARSLELFLAGNVHAMAVILPAGYDPDSFVREKGRQEMDALLAGAQPMADYYIDEILGSSSSLQDDRDKLREAVAFIKKIDDPVERNLFVKKVSGKLNVDQDVLKKEVEKHFSPPQLSRPATKVSVKDERLELSLIHLLLENPDVMPLLQDTNIFVYFRSAELKAVGELLLAHAEKEGGKKINVITILNGVEDETTKKMIYALLVGENPYDGQDAIRLLDDTARQLRRRWYRDQHRVLRERLAKAERVGDAELCLSLLREKERLQAEEKHLDG